MALSSLTLILIVPLLVDTFILSPGFIFFFKISLGDIDTVASGSIASKLEWLHQDIVRLLDITFHSNIMLSDLERTISKEEETELLNRFNIIVNDIAKNENINPTLFFSKKIQKDFLRLVLSQGLDIACENITFWRKDLIREHLLNILK